MTAPHDGARGDKRKAHDDDRWSHYDGDVRDLIERARAEGRAEGWDEAVEAVAWCWKQESAADPFAYVAANNPYRALGGTS